MIAGAPPRFHNSLSRRVEEFRPLVAGQVRMYTCGPTVYSYAHLGNMRPYVFSDTLRRLLEWKGLAVTQVVNITDVGHTVGESDLGEDKVEAAARRELRSVEQLTEHYTEAYLTDMARLNVRPAAHYPRASAYVPRMIDFARVLDGRGCTYRLDSGLYFDTAASTGYGRLALADLDGQREGARTDAVPGKRSGADFAVWRAEPPGQRRVMRWDSPWGPGVPGWHLECSVMSIDLLGEHFDIHTGGVDHREIHHINEIAQSEAYLGDGRDWVPMWMHNEFIVVNSEKISKSAGRMPLLSDVVAAGRHPLVYRYFLLTAQYRSQLDLTDAALGAAEAALRRLAGRVERLRPLPPVHDLHAAQSAVKSDRAHEYVRRLDEALSDDLSTPRAVAELQQILRDEALVDGDRAALVAAAESLLGLGLDTLTPDEVSTRAGFSPDADPEVDRLLAAREAARTARDWAEADKLRARLADLGWRVTDTPQGPKLEAL